MQKYFSTSDKAAIPAASTKTHLSAVAVYKLAAASSSSSAVCVLRGRLAQLEIRWLVPQV